MDSHLLALTDLLNLLCFLPFADFLQINLNKKLFQGYHQGVIQF